MILLLPFLVVVAVLLVRRRDARLAAQPDGFGPAATTWTPARARPVPDRARAVLALTRVEARRLVTHPAVPVGLVLGLLAAGVGRKSAGFERYITLTGGGPAGLYLPPLVFVAANLCASRTRRSHAGEVFDATAAAPYDRTLAQCLAALGPAGVSAALLAAGWAYYDFTGLSLPAAPSVWELLSLPLAVLGAGVLGVMVARWLPFRGASLAVLVGIVFASAWVSSRAPMLISYTEFPHDLSNETFAMGNQPVVAHAFYVLGLDAMAVVGALLVHRVRTRLLLGLGAVVTGGTVWFALLAT